MFQSTVISEYSLFPVGLRLYPRLSYMCQNPLEPASKQLGLCRKQLLIGRGCPRTSIHALRGRPTTDRDRTHARNAYSTAVRSGAYDRSGLGVRVRDIYLAYGNTFDHAEIEPYSYSSSEGYLSRLMCGRSFDQASLQSVLFLFLFLSKKTSHPFLMGSTLREYTHIR